MDIFNTVLAKITRGTANHHVPDGTEDRIVKRDDLFDNVARTLASPIPRRQVLKLALSGIISAVLAELGFNATKLAAANCMCQGVTYDPAQKCCTNSGVQPRKRYYDLQACPNRSSNREYEVFFGCDYRTFGTPYFKGRWAGVNFDFCCFGLGLCNAECDRPPDKDFCDNQFKQCFENLCKRLARTNREKVTKAMCESTGNALHKMLQSDWAKLQYDHIQRNACDCCPETQSCCSAPFQDCSGPVGNCECYETLSGELRCMQLTTGPAEHGSSCGPEAGRGGMVLPCNVPGNLCVRAYHRNPPTVADWRCRTPCSP